MNAEEYQRLAERTSATASLAGQETCRSRIWNREIRLLHGLMGLCTEAGEAQDALKRTIFYGVPLDEVNLAEEVGDLFWYCAEILNTLDVNVEEVMQKNIDKLKERFPESFNSESALNRNLEQERKALED